MKGGEDSLHPIRTQVLEKTNLCMKYFKEQGIEKTEGRIVDKPIVVQGNHVKVRLMKNSEVISTELPLRKFTYK